MTTTSSLSWTYPNLSSHTKSSQSDSYWKAVFSGPAPPQNKNCQKSVLSRLTNPPKVKAVERKSFQDHHTLSYIQNLLNQFFQDHHLFPKWKLLKMSLCKTTTAFPRTSCPKSILWRAPHHPKVKLPEISPFKTTTINTIRKYFKILPFKTDTSLQTGSVENQSFWSPPHTLKVETVQHLPFQDTSMPPL